MLNFFAGRVIDNLVVVQLTGAVDARINELITQGGTPVVYANHQGHPDGIALAQVSSYLQGRYNLPGLAAILASSMSSGQQGAQLKAVYDLLVEAGRKRGLEPIPFTRRKDEERYGMDRQTARELRPLGEKIREGYGLALLPEGSIQGGRHPEGMGIEDIYGMQKVNGGGLITFFELANRWSQAGKTFFLPVALEGSFRIMQSLEGEVAGETGEPKLTRRGKWSLFLAALGIPFGRLKIKATLLTPFTEKEIRGDLGDDWRRDDEGFNAYAMRKLLSALPHAAWGDYRLIDDVT